MSSYSTHRSLKAVINRPFMSTMFFFFFFFFPVLNFWKQHVSVLEVILKYPKVTCFHISLRWAQLSRAVRSHSQGHFHLLSLVLSSCSCLSVCTFQPAVSPSFENINITSWKEQTVFCSSFCIGHLFDDGPKLCSFFSLFFFFFFPQCGLICIQKATELRDGRREVGVRLSARGGWWKAGGGGFVMMYQQQQPSTCDWSEWLTKFNLIDGKWECLPLPHVGRLNRVCHQPEHKLWHQQEGGMVVFTVIDRYIIECVFNHILLRIWEFQLATIAKGSLWTGYVSVHFVLQTHVWQGQCAL